MQVRIDGKDVLMRLDPGEEMVSIITKWAKDNHIPSAVISGLGAVRDVRLGYFDLNDGKYIEIPVARHVEIVSLDGSIALLDGEPHLHMHVTVSSSGGGTIAGHLFQAVISITAELHLTILKEPIKRVKDPVTGILMWDLS
jgi:uncharacterized protein